MIRRIAVGLFLIFGIWSIAHYGSLASPQILPNPILTLKTLGHFIVSGTLNADVLASGKRWFLGFACGVLIGAPIGLAMGHVQWVEMILAFPVDFLRSLPVTALFPVFLLVFGIQDAGKIAMVATSVACVVVVTANYGVRHAPQTRLQMARAFGASKWQKFADIILPQSVGQIISGMRVGLGTSLVVVVVAEMFIGSRLGLGTKLYDAYSINAVPEMYALLLMIGFIGYLLNLTFLALEKRIAFWIGK